MQNTNIIERANAYIAQYVKEHYLPPIGADEELLEIYNDKWYDSFRSKTHDFQVETSFELMDMINHCNQHDEFHDFNQGLFEVKDITSMFLYTLLSDISL
jgi:hypothetical protein